MAISNEGYKQVVLSRENTEMITWLSVAKLHVGLLLSNGYRVKTIFHDAVTYRCPNCKRLCASDVTNCLCK